MNRLLVAGGMAFAVAAAGMSQSAIAREPGMPRAERTFERLDKNKDGTLTLQELEARSMRRFMRLDKDNDNKVTEAELENWLNAIASRRIKRILSRMDGDNDKAVTRAELQKYIQDIFTKADSDLSGGVTLPEARAYHVERRKARSKARKAARATRN